MNDGFEFPCSRKVSCCYNSGAKLYPLERKLGSNECSKNVLKYMCNMMSETDTFPSSVTGKSFGTNQKFYYNKKCLVSLTKVINKQNVSQVTINVIVERLIDMKIICKNNFAAILNVKGLMIL